MKALYFDNLDQLPFPKEVIPLVGLGIIQTLLGDTTLVINSQNENFWIPKINLSQHKNEAIFLMWASGYYQQSEIGRLFGISRQAIWPFIQKLKHQFNFRPLAWLTYGEIKAKTEIRNYLDQYIKKGNIPARHFLGRNLVKPEDVAKLIKYHRRVMSKKRCFLCNVNITTHKYCDNCRPIMRAKAQRYYRQIKTLTLKNCPAWAKPIYKLSHGNKNYSETELISCDEAAKIIGVTHVIIYIRIRQGLFKKYYLRPSNSTRMVMAVPKEQIELYRDLNPYLKFKK